VEGFVSRIYLNDFICEKMTGIKHSTILDAIVHLHEISECSRTWDRDFIDTWHKMQEEKLAVLKKKQYIVRRGSEIARKSRTSALMSYSVADLMRGKEFSKAFKRSQIEHQTGHHTTLDDGASPNGIELQDIEKGKEEAKEEESKNKVNDSSALLNPTDSAKKEVKKDELKAKRENTVNSLHSVTSEELHALKSCCTNRKRQGKFVKKKSFFIFYFFFNILKMLESVKD